MRADPTGFLPLKPPVLEILLSLAEGERHGYALLGEIESRAEAGDVETARALAPKLEAEYDAVMGYLRGALAER